MVCGAVQDWCATKAYSPSLLKWVIIMNSFKKIALVAVLTTGLSACATDGSINRTQTGAAVGAVAGAILGHQVDDDKGRYVGAIAGAIAGSAVGKYMDEQQEELEAQLRREQAADEIQISRLADNTLKLDLSSEVSFDVNSARINRGFYQSLNKVASVLADYPSTAVHIVGHTDSTGADAYNHELSLKRATSVKGYLTRQGVDEPRTRTDGRGETAPVASNATSDGRSRNRRVEIFLKPIVEGREASAFRSPV